MHRQTEYERHCASTWCLEKVHSTTTDDKTLAALYTLPRRSQREVRDQRSAQATQSKPAQPDDPALWDWRRHSGHRHVVDVWFLTRRLQASQPADAFSRCCRATYVAGEASQADRSCLLLSRQAQERPEQCACGLAWPGCSGSVILPSADPFSGLPGCVCW
ncbi:hypothetical protein BD289DRAFT_32742 [Coniella lustricola]|uniref:Uncharacterized protein n=1 Tax=Coniella lustricola TaxID=2025994 RepID=A0A2T3A2R7_9PEZI|nr:hypothetical protein BD289DRAFT_32742 [Coniella lustricola]